MNEIFLYMDGRPKRFAKDKGILLWGSYGTGKSTILKIMNYYSRHSLGQDKGGFAIGGILIKSASEISNLYATNGFEALARFTYDNGTFNTVAFDELGKEPMPAKHYGTEMNVMQYVLQCRYEIRSECLTHVTTNLSPAEIQHKYGGYIADRVNEMFNVIEVKGSSRR